MDQDELKKIIDAHGEHLLKMAFFYLRDREMVKDIVQDVFISFYASTNYEERGTLRAYLTKLTVNRCKDHLRSWSFRICCLQMIGWKRYISNRIHLF